MVEMLERVGLIQSSDVRRVSVQGRWVGTTRGSMQVGVDRVVLA